MSASTVYSQIYKMLEEHLEGAVEVSTLLRLALLVTGILHSQSASPAAMARALKELGLSRAKTESLERQVRRIENDPELTAALCVHPVARERLLWGRPRELVLILDPTTQEERVVMLTVAVWYRGRALPLAWAIWPGNTPLTGARFWERVQALLDTVALLLPVGIPVTWLADRAFGTPAFTDQLVVHGWHYVVRIQGQTRCRDQRQVERSCRDLVRRPGQRAKLRGEVFKKSGWRAASVVAYWGRRYASPLCLVTDRGAHWWVLRLYRRRFPIEALFRDYKTHGWHWEQGQVTDLAHLERLLVGMALAVWVVLAAGTAVAEELLAHVPSGCRRTVPWAGKRSLFHLGLHRVKQALGGAPSLSLQWCFADWDAPNWQTQLWSHYLQAFIWKAHQDCRCFSHS